MPMSIGTVASIPMPRSRTLVLCFDGTSNQFDGDNTNVVKFYSLLKKSTTDDQLCYYQPGVGTYFQPGVVSPFFQWGAKILDQAVAWYLDEHVRGGYTFLMQNYRPGDKICIFGFSRGAYTARALAGFLHKLGLLPKDNAEQVPIAYRLYTRTDAESIDLAAGFKQTFCRSVKIEFMGVWDTVASVGVIRGKTLPFTTTNTTIKTFRHALSLDEHRAKFRPNLYHRLSPNATRTVTDLELAAAIADAHMTRAPDSASSTISDSSEEGHWKDKTRAEEASPMLGTPPGKVMPLGKGDYRQPFPYLRAFTRQGQSAQTARTALQSHVAARQDLSAVTDPCDDFIGVTDVLEVWFAGCHSDVGGGAVSNATPHALSDISLRWMVRQVVQAQCGILFDRDALMRASISESIFADEGRALMSDPNKPTVCGKVQPTLYYFAEPKDQRDADGHTGAVQNNESEASNNSTALDAKQDIHDELIKKPMWWLLELIPTNHTYQDGAGAWHNRWSIHGGRGRRIPDIKPNFHESVRQRMNDKSLNYKPRATWKANTENYVS